MNEAKLDERQKRVAWKAWDQSRDFPNFSVVQRLFFTVEAVLSASGLVSKEERDREWDEAVRTYFWVCFGHFDIVMLKMIRKRLGLAPASGEPAPKENANESKTNVRVVRPVDGSILGQEEPNLVPLPITDDRTGDWIDREPAPVEQPAPKLQRGTPRDCDESELIADCDRGQPASPDEPADEDPDTERDLMDVMLPAPHTTQIDIERVLRKWADADDTDGINEMSAREVAQEIVKVLRAPASGDLPAPDGCAVPCNGVDHHCSHWETSDVCCQCSAKYAKRHAPEKAAERVTESVRVACDVYGNLTGTDPDTVAMQAALEAARRENGR